MEYACTCGQPIAGLVKTSLSDGSIGEILATCCTSCRCNNKLIKIYQRARDSVCPKCIHNTSPFLTVIIQNDATGNFDSFPVCSEECFCKILITVAETSSEPLEEDEDEDDYMDEEDMDEEEDY